MLPVRLGQGAVVTQALRGDACPHALWINSWARAWRLAGYGRP